MTVNEMYALSAERQANIAYRKKIQRIKNTLLGVLVGGGAGAIAGKATDIASQMNNTSVLKPISFSNNKNSKSAPLIGGSIGALLGGIGGYGLTRLNESYNESAGLDPTLANLIVHKAPEMKEASAKLQKSASPTGLALKQLFRSSKKGIGRLAELLEGGNKKVLKDYDNINRWLDAAANRSTRLGDAKGNLYYKAMRNRIDQLFRSGNGRHVELELPGRKVRKTVWAPSDTAGAAANATPTGLPSGKTPLQLPSRGSTPQLTHVPQLTNKVPQLTNKVPQLPYNGGPVVPVSGGGALVPTGRGGAVVPYRGAAPAAAPSASPAVPTRGGAIDMVPQTVTENTVRRFQATKAIADELRKVRLARYGAAGALGIGAGGFMLGRASKGDQG